MTASATRSTRSPDGHARLLAGVGGAATLRAHEELYGPLEHPRSLIELVGDANLRGRGGAAFPTAVKLDAVRSKRGAKSVVGNGAEGEPVSKKDRSLLRVAPHLVLDGMALAAAALGATEAVVAVSRPAPELAAAIGERRDPIRFELRTVPDRFVAGEESALVRALGGGPAKPTTKPPYPFEQGLHGKPTLVQNVETLAQVALIARFGPRWFGAGTTLVTLAGAFARPGVHELPLGVTLGDAIRASGGLAAEVSAFLVGGYFGRWVPAGDALDLRLTPEVLGAGSIVALPRSTCAAAECARVVRYLAGETAGQCGPCVHGLAALADAFDVSRRGDRRAAAARYAGLVEGRGACRHPDGVAKFVSSAQEVLAEELARHASHRGCGRRDERVLPTP